MWNDMMSKNSIVFKIFGVSIIAKLKKNLT